MKLLSKKKVNSVVEEQKANLINEGVILAKKVDALRIKLADLEKQHNLFLLGMETELKEKTDKLFQEIQTKERELIVLEEKRKELVKPLDLEWETLKTAKDSLLEVKAELGVISSELEGKAERTVEREKKSKEILNNIKVRERELSKVYLEAEEDLEIIKKTKQEIINKKDNQDRTFDLKNRELSIKEDSIKSYEFTLKQREESLNLLSKELDEDRVRCNDLRATLERAIARTKKK